MIQILHPLVHSLVATGEMAEGLDILLIGLAIYVIVVAFGLAVMICQVAALVWFWRASGRADGEETLRARWARVFMIVNWLWLGILGTIGYLLRDTGQLLLVWAPLVAFSAMTVLHLLSLHRHAAVSFAVVIGAVLYAQIAVPTVTSRLQKEANKSEIRRLLQPEEVANRERFQREEFSRQHEKVQIATLSRQIDETTTSLIRISHVLRAGSALGEEERVLLKLSFIEMVYACHQTRERLARSYSSTYFDRQDRLKHHIDLILSWDEGTWLQGDAAHQVDRLKQYHLKDQP